MGDVKEFHDALANNTNALHLGEKNDLEDIWQFDDHSSGKHGESPSVHAPTPLERLISLASDASDGCARPWQQSALYILGAICLEEHSVSKILRGAELDQYTLAVRLPNSVSSFL